MWTGRITDSGRAMLAEWVSGKVIIITKATAGTGTFAKNELRESIALCAEKQVLGITSLSRNEGGTEIKVRFNAHSETYRATQIGIWARMDGSADTLIAIYQNDSDGIEVPAADEMVDFVYTFYARITANVEADYQITVDAASVATKDDIENARKEIRPIENGGTGADNDADARKNIGAVFIGGDRMTGKLTVPELEIDTDAGVIFRSASLDKIIAHVSIDSQTRKLSIRQLCSDTAFGEIFTLPAPSTGRTGNGIFEFLTTKNVVTIPQGGTGATTAEMARENLGINPANIGAIKNDGDTMTGWLKFDGNAIGTQWTTTDGTVFQVRSQRGNNILQITANGAATGNAEFVSFAVTNDGSIQIGKSLPIKYGGTGAATASAARTALGITPANIGAASSSHGHVLTDTNITGTLGIKNGGTGAANAAEARTALGITPANIGAAPTSHQHVQLLKYNTTYHGTMQFMFVDYKEGQLGIRIQGAYSADDSTNTGMSLWMNRDTGLISAAVSCKNGTYYPDFYTTHNKPSAADIGALSSAKDDLAETQKAVFSTQAIPDTAYILELDNGHYHHEGAMSADYGWPWTASAGRGEVVIQGNRNGKNGYWYVVAINTQTGDVYINTHAWNTWKGWKKITMTAA